MPDIITDIHVHVELAVDRCMAIVCTVCIVRMYNYIMYFELVTAGALSQSICCINKIVCISI